MPRRRRTARGSRTDDLPVSSFADIAFLLIIFFILATELHSTMGFLTDLPAGQKTEAEVQDKTTAVHLREGRILLDDEQVSLDELRRRLAGMGLAARAGDDRVVLLEAGERVAYQAYYEVMAAISQAGGVIGIVREEAAP